MCDPPANVLAATSRAPFSLASSRTHVDIVPQCANQSIEAAYSDQALACKSYIRKRLREGADEDVIKKELVNE